MELKKITTPKKIEALEMMGITSVEELLSHYPFRYENNEKKDISEWNVNDKIFTEKEISKKINVSQSYTSRLIKNVLIQLKKQLENSGKVKRRI